MFGTYMPMGLLAIADYADRQGYKTEVLHPGIEWINNKSFSLISHVEKCLPRLIGLSLHWHQQSYDVIETARVIKFNNPDIFIVLGGLTASYFHEDILNNFNCIDGVIRGDGEVPFLKLAEEICRDNKDLSRVPNLSWRKNSNLKINEVFFVPQSEDLDKFNFTNFNLLKNHRLYMEYVKIPWFWIYGINKWMNMKLSQLNRVFPLPMFRGCPVNCSFCGGSNLSQKLINGRTNVSIRSIDKVIDSIKEAKSYGYKTVFIEHLCLEERERYFSSLFQKIKEEKLKINCILECGPLPSQSLINLFKNTFLEDNSMILLSPESSSEIVRNKNKGYRFSNRDLLETLRLTDRLKIPVEMCFALGLPFETLDDLEETKKYHRFLKSEFKNTVTIRTQIIELDPGSPMYENPSEYHIIREKKSFLDFYRQNKNKLNSCFGIKLGYYHQINDEAPQKIFAIDELNPLEQLLQTKMCNDFCRIANLFKGKTNVSEKIISRFSKITCCLMSFFWKIKKQDKFEIR